MLYSSAIEPVLANESADPALLSAFIFYFKIIGEVSSSYGIQILQFGFSLWCFEHLFTLVKVYLTGVYINFEISVMLLAQSPHGQWHKTKFSACKLYNYLYICYRDFFDPQKKNEF